MTPGAIALRNIERNAVRLRERIQRGECPYPDALQEANEAFIDRLQRKAGEDVPSTIERVDRAANRAALMNIGATCLQVAGTGALLIYAFNCAPLMPAMIVAGSAAAGITALTMLRKSSRAGIEADRAFGKQLEAWSAAGDAATPQLVSWRGPMPLSTLHNLTRTFAADVRPLPYGDVVAKEHERLMGRVPNVDDKTVSELKTTFLARSKRFAAKLGKVAGFVCAAAVPSGFAAGMLGIVLGNPWMSVGAFAAGAVAWGLTYALKSGTDARDARSLHYWEMAMGAVPPAAPAAAAVVEPAPAAAAVVEPAAAAAAVVEPAAAAVAQPVAAGPQPAVVQPAQPAAAEVAS